MASTSGKSRIWNGHDCDSGERHVIGNGRMLFYFVGPNIEHGYGCCYSSPPFFEMHLQGHLTCAARREPGTAIWTYDASIDGCPSARFTDVMHPDEELFVRSIETDTEMTFRLNPRAQIEGVLRRDWLRRPEGNTSALLLIHTKGPVFLPYDPVDEDVHMAICALGNGSVEQDGDGYLLTAKPGRSIFAFCSGSQLPEIVATLEDLPPDNEYLLRRSRAYWREYTQRRPPFADIIPATHPRRGDMLDSIDSTAVLLKCSQSQSGGATCGHWYSAMGYMRDMSGIFRGFLALGYLEEARAMLMFWKDSFEKYGRLHNAECLGPDHVRLMAGNNDVEVPAYLVLNCFFYHQQTGDDGILEAMAPVMAWALDVQIAHLAGGMTEFSFDETYIAGGIFPKALMYQGSAESTLMFLTGGRHLLDWSKDRRVFSTEQLERWGAAVEDAERSYRQNFVIDGLLFTNNPLREILSPPPRFRTGFCAGHGKLANKWLEPDGRGNYLCETCLAKGVVLPENTADHSKRYLLNSVGLLPLYINAPLFSDEEKAAMAHPGIALFQKTGKVPSDINGKRSLGYDYGLMLYALVVLDSPLKEAMLTKMLDLLDTCCLWGEYYDDDVPAGCRARPWESGINILALIEYIKGSGRR